MHNQDTNRYDELKRKLLEALEEVDKSPWVLIDYPSNGLPNSDERGIYTGRLSRVCRVIQSLGSGVRRCEKNHLRLVEEAERGEKATWGETTTETEKSCWAKMCYIVRTVCFNGTTRVFLIGQRLADDMKPVPAAINALRQLKSDSAFEQELKEAYDGNGEVEQEKLNTAFYEKLKIVFEKVPRMEAMDEEKRQKVLNVVEEYVKKIEEDCSKINFKELEARSPKGKGREKVFPFKLDPFEVSLDLINRKYGEEDISELYEDVFQNHHKRINEEFDKNKNIGKLILHKEKGDVKLEPVLIGKDFLAVRKRLQDQLRKYCYSFSRPEISEEISDWLPISSVNDPPDDCYPTIEIFIAETTTKDEDVFKTPRIVADFDTGGGMSKYFKESGEKYSSFKLPVELAKRRDIVLLPEDYHKDHIRHAGVLLSGFYTTDCKVGLRWGKEILKGEVKTVNVIFLNDVYWDKLRDHFNIHREAFVTRDIFYFFNKIRMLLDVENKKTIILEPVFNRTI